MIVFDQVTKRYPGSGEILQQVSFTIHEGDMVFVTGHSGAGKSTLLKLIAAIERPTHGTVLINQQNVSKISNAALPYLRRKFGLIFKTTNCSTIETVFTMLHCRSASMALPVTKQPNACVQRLIKLGC